MMINNTATIHAGDTVTWNDLGHPGYGTVQATNNDRGLAAVIPDGEDGPLYLRQTEVTPIARSTNPHVGDVVSFDAWGGEETFGTVVDITTDPDTGVVSYHVLTARDLCPWELSRDLIERITHRANLD